MQRRVALQSIGRRGGGTVLAAACATGAAGLVKRAVRRESAEGVAVAAGAITRLITRSAARPAARSAAPQRVRGGLVGGGGVEGDVAYLVDLCESDVERLCGEEVDGDASVDLLAEQLRHALRLVEHAGDVERGEAQSVVHVVATAAETVGAETLCLGISRHTKHDDRSGPGVAGEVAHVHREVADDVATVDVAVPNRGIFRADEGEEFEIATPRRQV